MRIEFASGLNAVGPINRNRIQSEFNAHYMASVDRPSCTQCPLLTHNLIMSQFIRHYLTHYYNYNWLSLVSAPTSPTYQLFTGKSPFSTIRCFIYYTSHYTSSLTEYRPSTLSTITGTSPSTHPQGSLLPSL